MGYFLTLAVLINIIGIDYVDLNYPVDLNFNCTYTAMEIIIAPNKRSDQVTHNSHFLFFFFTCRSLSNPRVCNFAARRAP